LKPTSNKAYFGGHLNLYFFLFLLYSEKFAINFFNGLMQERLKKEQEEKEHKKKEKAEAHLYTIIKVPCG